MPWPKLRSLQDEFKTKKECQTDDNCRANDVNNCQDGHCFCGDHFGGCIETSDTCHQVSNDKYEAVCGCGEKKTPCKEHQLCQQGKCISNTSNSSATTVQPKITTKGKFSYTFIWYIYQLIINNILVFSWYWHFHVNSETNPTEARLKLEGEVCGSCVAPSKNNHCGDCKAGLVCTPYPEPWPMPHMPNTCKIEMNGKLRLNTIEKY